MSKILMQRMGLIWLVSLLVNLSGLILVPLLTRNLSVEDYGTWAQVTVTVALVPILFTLGLPFAMVRFLASAKDRREMGQAFYSIICVVTIVSLCLSAVLYVKPVLASSIFDNDLHLVRWVALLIFLECLSNGLFEYFRSGQQMRAYSGFSLFKCYLGVVAICYMVLTGQGLMGAVKGLATSSMVSLSIMAIIVVSQVGFYRPNVGRLGEFLSFSIPTIPSSLSSWVVNSSDRYVIGLVLGNAFVGYYSPAYLLGTMLYLFSAPFSYMLPPALSQIYDSGCRKDVSGIMGRSLKYYLMMSIPAFFGLSILSRRILELLSTQEIAREGYLVVPFVAMGALLYGSSLIISNSLILAKRTGVMGMIWTMAAVLNLGLNLLIVPRIGILGAAITTMVAYLIVFCLMAWISARLIPLEIEWPSLAKIITASSVMSLVILISLFYDFTDNLIVLILVGIAAYLLFMITLRAIGEAELQGLRVLISNRSK